MSLYTWGFIIIMALLFGGLSLIMLLVVKLDKWIDKRERLGRDNIYRAKRENSPQNTKATR